jgi:hypothetical protein
MRSARIFERSFSRKGAKTQSAAAFPKDFLCAFAPLREKLPQAKASLPSSYSMKFLHGGHGKIYTVKTHFQAEKSPI